MWSSAVCAAALSLVCGLTTGGALATTPGGAERASAESPDPVIVDSTPSADAPAARPGGGTSARYGYSIPRASKDRPDIDTGRLVHVVYFLPSDREDDALDVQGVLDLSVRAQNAWMARETGGRTWRFDTFWFETKVDGATRRIRAVDVTFVRSKRPADQVRSLDGIMADLEAAGVVQPRKRYLVYAAVDGEGKCGQAVWPYHSLDPEVDGQFGAVYLDALPECHARDFAPSVDSPGMSETIAQQEMMHNDGAVPLAAPHHCLPLIAHVCTPGLSLTSADPERFDVLFPSPGVPLRDKHLDLGRDDYYETPVGTRDLARSPFLTPRVAGPRPSRPQH